VKALRVQLQVRLGHWEKMMRLLEDAERVSIRRGGDVKKRKVKVKPRP
jgi:hypothetical protein